MKREEYDLATPIMARIKQREQAHFAIASGEPITVGGVLLTGTALTTEQSAEVRAMILAYFEDLVEGDLAELSLVGISYPDRVKLGLAPPPEPRSYAEPPSPDEDQPRPTKAELSSEASIRKERAQPE